MDSADSTSSGGTAAGTDAGCCCCLLEKYFKIQRDLSIRTMKRVLEDPEMMAKIQSDPEFMNDESRKEEDKINQILRPIASKVFDKYDMDKNGVLSKQEAAIFFSQYSLGWSNTVKATIYEQQPLYYGEKQIREAIRELKEDDSDLEDGEAEKLARDYMGELFQTTAKSTTAAADDVYGIYLENKERFDKAAFDVIDIDKDGKLQREEVLQILELGSEKSKKLLQAFGFTEEILQEKARFFMESTEEQKKEHRELDSLPATHPYITKYFKKWNEIVEENNDQELEKRAGVFDPETEKGRKLRNEAKINKILQPIISQAFDYHDTDKNGILSVDEAAKFFSHYVLEWKNLAINRFCECHRSWEGKNKAIDLEEVKEHATLRYSLYKVIHDMYSEYLEKEEEHNKAAFEVVNVGKDGKLQREEVLKALEIGSEANKKLMEALQISNEELLERLHDETEKIAPFVAKKYSEVHDDADEK